MRVKEAVELASRNLSEVFPTATAKELRLEGLDKSDDGHFWKITFSYLEPTQLSIHSGTSTQSTPFGERVYKTVKLRDSDGELMGARNGLLLETM